MTSLEKKLQLMDNPRLGAAVLLVLYMNGGEMSSDEIIEEVVRLNLLNISDDAFNAIHAEAVKNQARRN